MSLTREIKLARKALDKWPRWLKESFRLERDRYDKRSKPKPKSDYFG